MGVFFTDYGPVILKYGPRPKNKKEILSQLQQKQKIEFQIFVLKGTKETYLSSYYA